MSNFTSNGTLKDRPGPSWRFGHRDIIRSIAIGAVAAALIGSATAQSPIAVYGYSRETVPGIPAGPGAQGGIQGQKVFPVTYYLFVEVERGSEVSAEWAWIRGNYYDCTLAKVSSPVTVESDPRVPTGMKETLVPNTQNDVYRVDLGNLKMHSTSNDREKELVANNDAVIALSVNKSHTYVAIKSLKALRPAAAM